MAGVQKKRFRIFKIVGIAAAVLLIFFLAIPLLIDANEFRPKLESELSKAVGRDVKVGKLKLSVLSGSVEADDIVIADDPAFSRSPFVLAKSLRVGVELKPLIFSKAVHITGIILDKPEITLIHSPSGDWNFSSIGRKSGGKPSTQASEKRGVPAGANISINLLKVSGGRVTAIRGSGTLKPSIYDNVEIVARELSFVSVFPFTLSATLPRGGSVRLEGKAGPVNSADASLTAVVATLAVERFDLIASGLVGPDSGLAALIDFQGSVTSDGKQMKSKGTASAARLRILKTGSPADKPVSFAYTLNHDLQSRAGSLSEAHVECGRAVAHLSGTYDARGDSVLIVLKLRGDNMPAQDLEALLPAVGVTLPNGASLQGGTANADLVAQGALENLVTSGVVGIFKTRLAGFDLGAKIATVASLAGIKPREMTDIETLSSDMRVAPDGIQVSRLVLIVPALGELTGYGTIGSGHSLDFKMLAKLNTSESIVNRLTQLARIKVDNLLNIPFTIGGTTANPTFAPDVKGVAGKILGSNVPGKDRKAGENSPSTTLEDALRGLLGKKKK